jgi:predicted RNA-binding protein Jag
VHLAVREHDGLGSRSEGNGYLKRVRIYKQK